jgi:hypothetical protein
MSVIPLTVFFSLLLAGLFMVLFAHEQRRRRFASAERDSLLPLADERPRLAAKGGDHAPLGLNQRGAQVPPVQSAGSGGPSSPDDDLYF